MRRLTLVQYHGRNRATFRCPDGHLFDSRLIPKTPKGREPGETACQFIAGWWRKVGVNMPCPKCKDPNK